MSPLNITQPKSVYGLFYGNYKVMSNIPKMGQANQPLKKKPVRAQKLAMGPARRLSSRSWWRDPRLALISFDGELRMEKFVVQKKGDMENHMFLIDKSTIVIIFNSYVKLPEGNLELICKLSWFLICMIS